MSEAQEQAAEQPITPDAALLGSHDIALKALTEITGVQTIGALHAPEVHEPRLITMFFESLLAGYPGWRWAVTLAKVSDDDPVTVLELALVPGEQSLLAPDWVPWGERLASYREAQALLAEEAAAEGEDTEAGEGESDDTLDAEFDDDDVDDDDLDDDDLDDDEDDLLENDHSDFDYELDGVDIDALDESDEGDDESAAIAPSDEEE